MYEGTIQFLPIQAVFKKRYTKDQQVHEKVPNITKQQGMRSKTIVRYHLTLVRKAIRDDIRDVKCWQGMEKRQPLCIAGLLIRMQAGTTTTENRTEASQKIKNRTTMSSSNPTSEGYLSKGTEIRILKRRLHSYSL